MPIFRSYSLLKNLDLEVFFEFQGLASHSTADFVPLFNLTGSRPSNNIAVIKRQMHSLYGHIGVGHSRTLDETGIL